MKLKTLCPFLTLGRVKLKELMSKTGSKAFLVAVPSYTSLDSTQASQLLETDVYLDKIDRVT
jgi:hypothetical protein